MLLRFWLRDTPKRRVAEFCRGVLLRRARLPIAVTILPLVSLLFRRLFRHLAKSSPRLSRPSLACNHRRATSQKGNSLTTPMLFPLTLATSRLPLQAASTTDMLTRSLQSSVHTFARRRYATASIAAAARLVPGQPQKPTVVTSTIPGPKG